MVLIRWCAQCSNMLRALARAGATALRTLFKHCLPRYRKKGSPTPHTHIRCGKLLPIHLFSIDSVFVLISFFVPFFSTLDFPSLFLFIHLLLYMFLFSFYLSFFLFSFVQRFSHSTICNSLFTFFFGFLC